MFGAVKPWWNRNIDRREKARFDQLGQEDEDGLYLRQRTVSIARNLAETIIGPVTLVVLLLLIILNTVIIVRQTRIPTESGTSYRIEPEDRIGPDCGITIEDALARGCELDLLAGGWVNPACHDLAMAREAFSGAKHDSNHAGTGPYEYGLREWSWFEDAELMHPVQPGQNLINFITRRAHAGLSPTVYSDVAYHPAHCSYMARLATKGIDRLRHGERDVWIVHWATESRHNGHCEHVYGELHRDDQTGARRNSTVVTFGMGTCLRIG